MMPTMWLLLPALFACRSPSTPRQGPVDADGDGFRAAQDCDDGDPEVNPDADEVARDLVDNDCDGMIDCDDPDLARAPPWPGDLLVDDFSSFCAGATCRDVEGTVVIGEQVSDLSDLECLSAASGLFVFTSGVRDFRGLEGLGTLLYASIQDNEQLVSLDGLHGLREVVTLNVQRNTRLTSVPSFLHLTSIHALTMQANPSLVDIGTIDADLVVLDVSDHPVLTTLGGLSPREAESIVIADNPELTDVEALGQATHIGALTLARNASLRALPSLHGLQPPPTAVTVTDNAALRDFTWFTTIPWTTARVAITIQEQPHIEDVAFLRGITRATNLTFEDNPDLRTLSGLDDVTTAYDITLQGNPRLVDLTALQELETMSGVLHVANAPVASLEGLDGLERANGLMLDDLPNLVDVEPLAGLEASEGPLHLVSLPLVTSLRGLEGIERADHVYVRSCSTLTTLEGLGLHTVKGVLTIEDNTGLLNLAGLSGVDAVGQSLTIGNNLNLAELDGLEGLRSIGAATEFFGGHDLIIYDNPSLARVDALLGLEHVEDDVEVVGNPSLPAAEIGAMVQAIDYVGGTVVVDDNGGQP